MIRSTKILWGEGLFLRPQHFQRQDAYHEWRQAERAHALQPHGWGLRRLVIDNGALAAGLLRVTELQAIFPDGDLYCAPHDDELPPALSLSALSPGMAELTLHLALPPMCEAGSNSAEKGAGAGSSVRFVQQEQAAGDWFTQAVDTSVMTLRRRALLLTDSEPRAHLVSLPLLRLRRLAGGGFETDRHFVPPAVSLSAAPALQTLLRELLDALHAKVDALYGVHREPSRHVIEFRSGDIASFWLLHTCNVAYAGLVHLHQHSLLHPERLFERLLELAGGLMTFSRLHGLGELPCYDHKAPQDGFVRLFEIVRDLLETVISTRYFSITLEEIRPSFYQARLDSEKIGTHTRFYLCVQAGLPAPELVQAVPQKIKIGMPDDVDKLLLSATQGVRLAHAPQVPSAIPVRPGALYFALEPRGPLYERMLQARCLMLYAPNGLPELQLELVALNDGQ